MYKAEDCRNRQWQPLQKALMGLFMYMGSVTVGEIKISLYKHIWTRRYINIDDKGQAYQFNNGAYQQIEIADAISQVFM